MSKHKNIAIPTSGDDTKDQEEFARFRVHDSRIEANICPNGCGAMVCDDPYSRHCPTCNFVLFTNTPFVQGEA